MSRERTEQIKTLENDIKTYEDSIEQLTQQNEDLRLDYEFKRLDYEYFSHELSRLQGSGDTERIGVLEKTLEQLSEDMEDISETITDNENTISELSEKIVEATENLEKLGKEAVGIMGEIKEFGKKAAKTTASAVGSFAVESTKGAAKSAVSKINPFDKSINKNDIGDTGVEGIRLANKTLKDGKKAINTVTKSVKTVKNTVKTTRRTIKTSGDVIKATGKVAYRTVMFTVKTAIRTVRFTVNAVSTVVAVATNPIFLILIGALIIIATIAAAVILLLAGASGGSSTNGHAQAGAVGLVDVPSQYADALEYFNTAVENNKNGFYDIIDSMYYDYGDLTNSDVVYMEKTATNGNVRQYQRSFANDYQKNVLKNAWDMPITAVEAIAMAYIYMEKQLNDENNTVRQIYEITYTQEIFDEIISKCVLYTDSPYENQACPDLVCTAHYIHNPAYDTAWSNRNASVGAYNDWFYITELLETWYGIPDGASQAQYWDNNIGWRIDDWDDNHSDFIGSYSYTDNQGHDFLDTLGGIYGYYDSIYQNTPETIVEQGCDYVHTLHSVGLAEYSKEDVMTALGFDDSYIQWYELTLQGFENNPDLA